MPADINLFRAKLTRFPVSYFVAESMTKALPNHYAPTLALGQPQVVGPVFLIETGCQSTGPVKIKYLTIFLAICSRGGHACPLQLF